MGCAIRVHKTLGPGFLESAYGDALEIEFARAGIPYVREDEVRVVYDGQPLKTTYRADFTCFDRSYIVELKAIRSLSKVEWAQVIHYMRATKIRFALLVNFGRAQLQYETFDLECLPTASVADSLQPAAEPQLKHLYLRPWKANARREALIILRSGSESPTARSFYFANAVVALTPPVLTVALITSVRSYFSAASIMSTYSV